MKGIFISPTGAPELRDFDDDPGEYPHGRYAQIKACLNDGYLEAVPIGPGMFAYVDEDGKSKNLPTNRLATDLYNTWLRENGRRPDRIVGPVVIFANDGSDDLEHSVSVEVWEAIVRCGAEW